MEANGASSKKDFQNKIFICKKESQEVDREKGRNKKIMARNPRIDFNFSENYFVFKKII